MEVEEDKDDNEEDDKEDDEDNYQNIKCLTLVFITLTQTHSTGTQTVLNGHIWSYL